MPLTEEAIIRGQVRSHLLTLVAPSSCLAATGGQPLRFRDIDTKWSCSLIVEPLVGRSNQWLGISIDTRVMSCELVSDCTDHLGQLKSSIHSRHLHARPHIVSQPLKSRLSEAQEIGLVKSVPMDQEYRPRVIGWPDYELVVVRPTDQKVTLGRPVEAAKFMG